MSNYVDCIINKIMLLFWNLISYISDIVYARLRSKMYNYEVTNINICTPFLGIFVDIVLEIV